MMNLLTPFPHRLFGNLDEFLSLTLRDFGLEPTMRAQEAYRAENDQAYRLRFEIPGYSPEELTLEVHRGTLKLHGKSETSSAEFEQAFKIPESVEQDAITAKLENGILELTLPKMRTEEPTPRTITINKATQ